MPVYHVLVSAATNVKAAVAAVTTRAMMVASIARRSRMATVMVGLRKGRRKVIGSRYQVLGDR
jgi:hypothetical protein